MCNILDDNKQGGETSSILQRKLCKVSGLCGHPMQFPSQTDIEHCKVVVVFKVTDT